MTADRVIQLKKMLEVDPRDTFCLYGLGMEYAKREEHGVAVSWFDQAIQIDPNYLYAYFHKAKSQAASGDLSGAEGTLQVGLKHANVSGDAKAANEIASLLDEYSEAGNASD